MELKVRKIGNGYGVIFPKALLDDMAVSEGTLFTAEHNGGVLHMTPVDAQFSRQIEAFLNTEADHRRSYRELAK